MIDLAITDALIVDGTGSPPRSGTVAIDGGKVVEAGAEATTSARRVVDAGGQVVSPGFFDMHTHYDAQWFWDPTASSSCWHGVTSVLTGNCGFSLAPITGPADRDYLRLLFSQVEGVSLELLDEVLDWSWTSFGDYLDAIRPSLGINVAAQVGHSALRHGIMGADAYERAATPDEIAAMAAELRRSIDAGAIGFSTLQAAFEVGPHEKPVPSQLATADEMRALADAIGAAGRGVITVSPHPGAAEIGAEYRELLIDLSRRSGHAVMWNAFQHRWDQPDGWRDLLAFMDHAASVDAEVYAVAKAQRLDLEFELGPGRLFVWYPTWHEVLHRTHGERLDAFADADMRATLRAEYDVDPEGAAAMRSRYRILRFLSSTSEPGLAGRLVADVANERRAHPVDVMLDVAIADDLTTRFVYQGMMNGDEDAVRQILLGDRCVPGVSDAGAHLDMDCGVDFTSRLLGHWSRDEAIMPLEEAVRRLTSMSAGVLGVTDRGTLAPGQAADVVIFDPATIGAGPREWLDDVPRGGRRLVQRSIGVDKVLVNGEVLIDAGEHTGVLPGQVLKATT